MPFSAERTELIKRRLDERLEARTLNEWERSFLADMQARFRRYGGRTKLSERQYRKLYALLDLPKEQELPDGDISEASRATRSEPKRRHSRASNSRRQSYSRSRRPASPLRVIYGPRRAIRRVERQLGLPALLVIGFIALFGGIFSRDTDNTSPAHQPSQSLSSETGSEVLFVTGRSVNQRSGPGTENQIMGALSQGTSVKKISSQAGWTQIRSSLGTGWMATSYLSSHNPSAGSPQAPTKGRLIAASDVRVIDGDTVAIRGERANVRLVGFNTPEVGSAACNAEYALGQRATSRLREVIRGAKRIDFQRVACACRPGTEGTRACNYGRECGSLWVDGRDVGSLLISEGLAVRYICGRTRCPPRPGNWCR
ncbi:SH3 domain-containing protein [Thioclava sp. JE_KL1]|nr:SH3 domain-containing protein [Thioclava sp. JE_KL1]